MGVLVQPRNLVAPSGLRELPPQALPTMEDVEFVLVASVSAGRYTVSAVTRLIRERVANGLHAAR
ncbi:hypothetical protein SAMN05880582_11346 [Rhizobium sp. RU20A]|nr:hypothetical protein SAMN05880582_11346 [Rhizobium sp. RU20A]